MTLRFFPVVLALLAGCSRMPPGVPADLSKSPRPVVVIRGYLDWYSTGIERLTWELKGANVPAEAFREEQWGAIADELKKSPNTPVVLVGYSYGADDVILIARRLNDLHVPVKLLITIDPVTPEAVPANVDKCVNFYEPGAWDIFPWLRGIPLSGELNGPIPENINIRADETLNEPNTSHGTIPANEKVHRAIVELIQSTQTPGAGK